MQCNKRPAHSIISSARIISGSGTSRPSSLAAFRLMTSSKRSLAKRDFLVTCFAVDQRPIANQVIHMFLTGKSVSSFSYWQSQFQFL